MSVREIAAVLVSWRDEDDLLEAIASLAEARERIPPGGVAVSLAVVDNGGGLSREAVEAAWPDVGFLVNRENRGFGPAANQAARVSRGDVLLFLNPDVRAEGEPFSAIARALDADPEAVAVAPRLTDMNGAIPGNGRLVLAPPGREDQATFQLRRLPTLASDARELLLIDHLAPGNRGRRRARYADLDRASSFPVEQAAAAALAVRRSAFERLRGFDERYVPAWYEDVDLCDRLGREGRILYLPSARFRHRGGHSAAKLGYARFLPLFYRNALQYRQKRYGAVARAAYRGLLAGGMVLRLAALPLRVSVPRSRIEAAKAYVGVLGVAFGLGRPAPGPPGDPQA
jgi:N-acetylglucosaminyl-diphospho-decaprenol L-rhamnosyltransferase